MSIAAWPSIDPGRSRSASSRARASRRGERRSRKRRATNTIISGPPTSSPARNCQPSSSASTIPSSATRFVEAISNAIAAVKLAPLRKSERARATAAYEHDDDAAPRPVATRSERGESSGRRRATSRFETTAWTQAERAKPRIRAQRISQVIPSAKLRARQSSCPTTSAPRGDPRDEIHDGAGHPDPDQGDDGHQDPRPHVHRQGKTHSPPRSCVLLPVRVIADELLDARRRPDERGVVEEVRRRVRDPALGRVEVVRTGRGVERVAGRDLVADDEDRVLGSLDEPAERPRVATGGIVEALAAGEGHGTRVLPLPLPVGRDRVALELADVDVVEKRLL